MILPFQGKYPRIDETAFVAESAYIIGDVEIGENSSVWFGTVIRGDTHRIRIGNRTNIQDNSVIHATEALYPTIIEDDVVVGHGVALHGCTLKRGCLIGIGAIVLDNTVVGEGAIVGAGSVVTEGTVIPAGTLAMGVPAKVKRKLNQKEIADILWRAGKYVELAKIYKNGLGI